MKPKIFLIFLMIFITGCSTPAELATPTHTKITLPPTNTLSPSPTAVPTASPNAATTMSPSPTFTPQLNPTVYPTARFFLGTPLPENDQPITVDNLNQLELVAQWGKGPLQRVAFSPLGDTFAVASNYGVAIYRLDKLAAPPTWIPFNHHKAFDEIVFSTNGEFLSIIGEEIYYLNIPSKQFIEEPESIRWPEISSQSDGYGKTAATSPDGAMEFRGRLKYIDYEKFFEEYGYEPFTEEMAVLEMYDPTSGELIYEFQDELIYITMDERAEPESCDLAYWSPCGNALMDIAAAPSKAAFSADSRYLALLFHAFSLSTDSYNTLRIYDPQNGKLILTIGSYNNPVKDFAFTSDSESILVGFVNGTVQIWDIETGQITFGAQHFNSDIRGFTYSADGRFLLVLRENRLEVRSSRDGSLAASYSASTYALSPDGDAVAIGDWDGMIRLRDIASGEIIQRFQGHSEKIFALAFSDDGLYLASSSEDCSIRLWNARTGEFQHMMEVTKVDYYEGIAEDVRIFIWYLEFLPDSPLIMGFGSFGTAVSWNRYSGSSQLVVESAPLDYYQGMMTVAPHYPGTFGIDLENDRFYIGDIAYNLQSGEQIGAFSFEEVQSPEGCYANGPVSVDGELVFTRGYGDREGMICVLDSQTLEVLNTISVTPAFGWGYSYISWPFLSPDGTQLVVPTYDGLIYVFQIND